MIALDPLDRIILRALVADGTRTAASIARERRIGPSLVARRMRRLEEAGYVSCDKGYEGRVPRTRYRLTATGRKALERYLAHMESIIRAARKA